MSFLRSFCDCNINSKKPQTPSAVHIIVVSLSLSSVPIKEVLIKMLITYQGLVNILSVVTGTMKTLATTIVVIAACLIVAVSTSVLFAMYANVLSAV